MESSMSFIQHSSFSIAFILSILSILLIALIFKLNHYYPSTP
jgi:hypothetical protein